MKPYSPENWMMENFCLITQHQDIEGLQRMHLVYLVLAAVTLLNMLRTKSRDSYNPSPSIPQKTLKSIPKLRRILEESCKPKCVHEFAKCLTKQPLFQKSEMDQQSIFMDQRQFHGNKVYQLKNIIVTVMLLLCIFFEGQELQEM